MIHRCPWPWRLALLAIYAAFVWVVLQKIENEVNPLGWDLQFAQEIQKFQEEASQ